MKQTDQIRILNERLARIEILLNRLVILHLHEDDGDDELCPEDLLEVTALKSDKSTIENPNFTKYQFSNLPIKDVLGAY